MGFCGKRGPRGGNKNSSLLLTSATGKSTKSNLESSKTDIVARIGRSSSVLSEPGTSTRVTRSNSVLSEPLVSTRITRSKSLLQERVKLTRLTVRENVKRNSKLNEPAKSLRLTRSNLALMDQEISKEVTRSSSVFESQKQMEETSPSAFEISVSKISSIVKDNVYDLNNKDLAVTSNENNASDNSKDSKTVCPVKGSSFLKMDEDFDIDTFLSNSDDKVVTTALVTDTRSDLSDDDFLSQFPTVDINKINQSSEPEATEVRKKTKAKYVIQSNDCVIKSGTATVNSSTGLNSNTAKASISYIAVKNNIIIEHIATKTRPLVERNIFIPSTSKDNNNSNRFAIKRLLNHDYKNDFENKKPKTEISQKTEKDLFIERQCQLYDDNICIFDQSDEKSKKHEKYEYETSYSEDTSDYDEYGDNDMKNDTSACDEYGDNELKNDTSEYDEYGNNESKNDVKDYEFPNLSENIEFNVNEIKSNVHSAFRGIVGEKRMQTFLKERYLTKDCIKRLYSSITNIPNDAIERDPHGLLVQLMPHQKHALKWMRWREEKKPSGGIIADDMGLGKTLQMIALILSLKNDKKAIIQANDTKDVSSDDELDQDWGYAKNDEFCETIDGRTLVVCPASVLGQWEREILSKCMRGSLRVFIYHGSSRNISIRSLAKYDVVITTYHLIQQEHDLHIAPSAKKVSKIFKIKWERVILDEAHYIRNYRGKISIATCELSSSYKWALTGTPIQNRKSDFYALLKFLKCAPFDEKSVWNRWVGADTEEANKRLKVITTTLMLRRTKAELIEKGTIMSLPDKIFDLVKVDLDFEEKIVYQKILLYSRSFFNEFLERREDRLFEKEFDCPRRRKNIVQQGVPGKISKLLLLLMKNHVEIDTYYILVLILRLRQMCCHPFLIKSMIDKEDVHVSVQDRSDEKKKCKRDMLLREIDKLLSDSDDEDDCDINDEMTQRVLTRTNQVFDYKRRGSKVRAILDVLHNIVEKGEKVVVVSQWVTFLKVIAFNLDLMEGANYEIFTGQVNIKDRQIIVDRLNDSDDKLNILLLSLNAGGVGLNLVGANNLLLIDLHWNPQLETQAMDRIYRFGQQNNVHIYKFVCKDTIEENIKKLQDRKLEIADKVLLGSISSGLTIEDLKLLFS